MKYYLKQKIFDCEMNIIYQDKEPSQLLLQASYFDVDRYYEGGKVHARFQKKNGETFSGEVAITKIIDKKYYGTDSFLIHFEAKQLS